MQKDNSIKICDHTTMAHWKKYIGERTKDLEYYPITELLH